MIIVTGGDIYTGHRVGINNHKCRLETFALHRHGVDSVTIAPHENGVKAPVWESESRMETTMTTKKRMTLRSVSPIPVGNIIGQETHVQGKGHCCT